MEFIFERGSADSPKGHSLIYITNFQNPDEVLATYLVVLPIQVDVSKYVPPFLMNQIGDISATDMSAFAFPPAPEAVSGADYVRELAEARDDDIVFGGSAPTSEVTGLLGLVNEVITWYADLYARNTDPGARVLDEPAQSDNDLSVNDVLYGLMSDRDKINELTRLVGRLRDAVGSGDTSLSSETQIEIVTLGRHLPESHQVGRIAETASSGGESAAQLTNLYLQRCFYLLAEEYVKLGQLEDEIRGLEIDPQV